MSLDDFVRHCCGDPDCPNDCEREPVPARRPEDDALDRLVALADDGKKGGGGAK